MAILSWMVIGALVGFLASRALPERFPIGIAGTAFGGIVGALLAGGVFSAIAGRSVAGFDLASLLVAFGGAVLLLSVIRTVGQAERQSESGGRAAGA